MSYTNNFRRAYHGTSKAALAGILKEGIVPAKGEGADQWARNRGRGQSYRERGVFMSRMSRIAAAFSQFAAQVKAGTWDHATDLVEGGVVLEVDMSKADPAKIKADPQFDRFEDDVNAAFIYDGVIPPSWIKCYREVHPVNKQFPGSDVRALIDSQTGLRLGEPVEVAA